MAAAAPLPFRGGSPSLGRGAPFICVCASVSVLVASFLAWYGIQTGLVTASLLPSYALTAPGYAGWRDLVPIVAAVTALAALGGLSFVRGSWPVPFVWFLRVGALATLGLVVAAMVAQQPTVVATAHQNLRAIQALKLQYSLGWSSWFGGCAALIGAAAALLSGGA
ncbi:MAG: hypothetical protein ACYDHU_06820 [Acidimicrobiales bacterium]